jgi:hypothetical protein
MLRFKSDIGNCVIRHLTPTANVKGGACTCQCHSFREAIHLEKHSVLLLRKIKSLIDISASIHANLQWLEKVMTKSRKFIMEAETLSELSVTVFKHVWEFILSLFSLFLRNKTRLMRLPFCLCLDAWTNHYETLYIMAAEPISTAYLINPTHQPLCLYVYTFYRCKATVQLSVSLLSVLGNGSVNTFPGQ